MKNLLFIGILMMVLTSAGCVSQDTPVVPAPFQTTVPATISTGVIPAMSTIEPVPTTLLTKVPIAVPTPLPKTVVGCWKFEHSVGDTTYSYSYDLQPGGTGWMYGTKTSPTIRESMQPERVTWSKDPDSAVVMILEANPVDPADPDRWVLTYDEHADILDGGEKGNVMLIYVRTPC
jgi:hypothetical protein